MSDTAFTSKPEAEGSSGSQCWGISIRAWLALIITMTVCINWTANTVMVSLGYTSASLTVPEPLYSVFVGVIGIYFGQGMSRTPK
jgi:hypothetical protein